jgi:penicillin-binding protein 2
MFEYKIRIRVFAGLIVAVLAVLAMRLVYLQLIDMQTYYDESSNAIRVKRVLPARGVIYDRNGVLMVDNQPSYTVLFTPRYFDSGRAPLLAELLEVPDSVVMARVQEAREWNAFRPSRSFVDVPFGLFSGVQENLYRLPGVSFEVSQKRRYLTRSRAWHALGFVREINRGELDQMRDDGYRQGDMIGRSGLERVYEDRLRGRLGSEFKLVNVMGMEVESYRAGLQDDSPISGYDLHLTIDDRVQALAESLFVNKRGAAVALDPNSGEVLVFVSKPDIDPKLFSSEVTAEEWQRVTTAPGDPLFNRATMSGMPPGSTWKPFMALVGLQEGIITPSTSYRCRGGYTLGRRTFKDHAGHVHGTLEVEEAIEQSCNSFFFNLMMQVDVDSFSRWARLFGFGERSEIDIAEQNQGLIPDSSYYDRTYPDGWTAGFTINLGIGQGDMLVTPLQLARYVAAIANDGTLVPPHFVRLLKHPETGEEIRPELPPARFIPISEAHFRTVKNGMRRVMENGTGRWFQIPEVASGGKTGTAQAPGGRADHSLFIMFAPYENPEIALAVLVENGGFGAAQAGPIASLLAESYLKGDIEPRRQYWVNHVLAQESEPIADESVQ